MLYAYASPLEDNETIDYQELCRETGATRVCAVSRELMGAITYKHDAREWLWIEHETRTSVMIWRGKMTFRLCSGALEDQPLVAAAEAAADICKCRGALYVQAEGSVADSNDSEEDEEDEDSNSDDESGDSCSGSDDDEDEPETWAKVMMKLARQKRDRVSDGDEAPVARALLDAVETYGPLAVQGQRRRVMRRLAAASILETLA